MSLKQNIYCFLLTCAVAIQATAQVTFSKVYDDYNAWEVASNIFENADSSILVLSTTKDFFSQDSTYYRRGYISQLDINGNVISRKTIPQIENTEFRYGLIEEHKNKLFVLTQSYNLDTLSDTTQFARLLYVDKNGEIRGSVNIPLAVIGNGKPSFGGAYLTPDGTYIGIATYNGGYRDSIYIFSSDTNGNVLWVKEHPELNIDARMIVQTGDKGFLLAGEEKELDKYVIGRDGMSLVYKGHPSRLWYAKIDSTGNLEWQKLLTGDYYELYDTIYHQYKLKTFTSFRGLIKTLDGNYVLSGYIADQPYMVKINDKGNVIWQSKYFSQLSYLDTLRRKGYFYDVAEKDGYLYTLGTLDSLKPGNTDPTQFYFLMKLTGTGRTVWTRYYDVPKGDYLYKITFSKTGFFLTGSKRDTTPNKYGDQDGWIMKVDPYGCLIPGCHLNDVIDTSTGIIKINQHRHQFTLYPNPVSTTLNLQSARGCDKCIFTVYNYSGQIITTGKISSNQQILVESMPAGLYVLEIKDESGYLERQKFFKD